MVHNLLLWLFNGDDSSAIIVKLRQVGILVWESVCVLEDGIGEVNGVWTKLVEEGHAETLRLEARRRGWEFRGDGEIHGRRRGHGRESPLPHRAK